MDEGLSPEAQRQALTEFAERKGYTIVAEYVDAESGRKEARSNFQAMVEAAERGEFQAVLLFHSSRFARDIEVARRYKRRLRGKGIKVIQLNVEIDPDTPSGFLLESVNEVLDEHYSRMLSVWIKSAFQEKHRQGGHSGSIPVGYDREKGGVLVPNKDAPTVRAAFKRYATGRYSEADIARWLADKGVKSRRREPLGVSGVNAMLRNRTYLGFVKHRGHELQGKHKPLIDEATFNEVQHQLDSRRRGESRPKRYRDYALSGMLVCAACGSHWRGRPDYDRKGNLVLRYYCYGPRDHGCPGKVRGVRAEKIETEVRRLVVTPLSVSCDENVIEAIRAEQPDRQRERQRLEGRLRRVTQLFEEGDIDREDFVAKRDLLKAEISAVHPAEVPPDVEQAIQDAVLLGASWNTMSPRAKRTALRFIVEEITVDNGTAIAVKFQPWVTPVTNRVYLDEALGMRTVQLMETEFTNAQVQALIEAGSADNLTQV